MGLVKLKDLVTSGEMSNKTSLDLVKSGKRVEDTKSKMRKREGGGGLSEERDLQLGEILSQSINR